MNIKLATLAAVSVLGFASAAFAEVSMQIECEQNHWCSVPVSTTALSDDEIIHGAGWEAIVREGSIFVIPFDEKDTSIVFEVASEVDGLTSYVEIGLNVWPNSAPLRFQLEAINDEAKLEILKESHNSAGEARRGTASN